MQQYEVNQNSINHVLTWIESQEIAIPEIQRPFVWDAVDVRDFIDSLYNGYPVGYLIAWRNPSIRLKDGTLSQGKRILIDGQQRVTALRAAVHGTQVIDKNYKRKRISIAFHPAEERFEVTNAPIRRDRSWIPDIATVFAPNVRVREVVDNYCEANGGADKYKIDDSVERLRGILNNLLGIIQLSPDLDVEAAAEIFRRVNKQGVTLNTADFAMSKMAASEQYDGHQLRKSIDYFCHLAVAPEAYSELVNDKNFADTEYFRAMEWLKNEKEDLYDPSYTDMLRVAFTSEFKRGRLDDLVALLSGRNFETRTFEEDIAEKTFATLKRGIMRYMKEWDFKQFVMILRSAGFVNSKMISSQNTLNFAYVLYLTLRQAKVAPEKIENLVRRWFVMSILTNRYGGSVETTFGTDAQNIASLGAMRYLENIERAELSDTFWNVGLPQQMTASGTTSRYFNVFLASQAKGNDEGFLSRDITVQNLLIGQKHIHHVFPRGYLKGYGFKPNQYNQVANYVIMQAEINIAIGDTPPETYFSKVEEQCRNGSQHYGAITDPAKLRENLASHCIPDGMDSVSAESYDDFHQRRRALVENYDEFLQRRRGLMAEKIRDYYRSL